MTCIRVMILAMATAMGSAAVGSADDAQAVLKKAITAHGGETLLKKYPAGTADVKGEIQTELGKSEFTGTLAYLLPDKYRIMLKLDIGGAKITIVQTVNGSAARITVNDMNQPLTDAQKQETIASAALQEIGQLVPLLDSKRFTIQSGESAKVNGHSADCIQVNGKAIGQVALYFDAKTGLLVQTVRQSLAPSGKKVEERSSLSEYKAINGIQSPTKVIVTHDGKPFMTMTMSNGKLIETLDEKPFTITK